MAEAPAGAAGERPLLRKQVAQQEQTLQHLVRCLRQCSRL